jgi:hypothetical protein
MERLFFWLCVKLRGKPIGKTLYHAVDKIKARICDSWIQGGDYFEKVRKDYFVYVSAFEKS